MTEPALPTDERDVLDWGLRASNHIHREVKKRELKLAITLRECGDCHHWMKKSECPREHSVNGRARGALMGDAPCDKFTEAAFSKKLRDERRTELTTLEATR